MLNPVSDKGNPLFPPSEATKFAVNEPLVKLVNVTIALRFAVNVPTGKLIPLPVEAIHLLKLPTILPDV